MHLTRLEIIRELRKAEVKSFSQLLSDVAETSDNLTYHLKYLIKDGYVESPEKGAYKLSTKGFLFINTNQDKYDGLYPTLSCMLIISDDKSSRLLMRQHKMPHIGALHDVTFMLPSDQSVERRIAEFCEMYELDLSNTTYTCTYRKRMIGSMGNINFDKVFLVHTAKLLRFTGAIAGREFVLMSESDIRNSSEVIETTKHALDTLLGSEKYVERLVSSGE